MQNYEICISDLGKLHRQDINLNHTLRDRQVFKIGYESRDSAWAKGYYLEATLCLKLEQS